MYSLQRESEELFGLASTGELECETRRKIRMKMSNRYVKSRKIFDKIKKSVTLESTVINPKKLVLIYEKRNSLYLALIKIPKPEGGGWRTCSNFREQNLVQKLLYNKEHLFHQTKN